MNYGIYISAEGAQAQTSRLEVLSNNLANVATVGFKRDLAICQARYAEATARGQDAPGSRSLNDLGGGVELVETLTDYSDGALKSTGIPSDLAIPGEGFFVVQRDGREYLTRAGNFQFDPAGMLVTQQGDTVLGIDGEPIVMDPAGGSWQFGEDGSFQQAGGIAPLALVMPASLGDLVKCGDNLFSSLGPTAPLEPEDRRVLAGQLEMSGVKPAIEMLEMIQTSRAFEANVNLIRNQDQMYGTLISRLLRA